MLKSETEKETFSEDILQSYFNQIKDGSLLTFEEEIELSKRIQGGDEAAKQRLISSNLRFVVTIAKSYKTAELSFMDIIQEGNLGLIKAAGKYDFRKNVRFSTYASWWIKQSIARALSNKRRAIRLPHRKEETIKKIQKSYILLSQELSRKPTIEEIARELRMKPSEVDSLMNMAGNVVSLDSEVNDDSSNILDLYEDYSYDPDKQLMDDCLKTDTLNFLETLVEKEKRILMYRFAFFDGKRMTLKNIGEKMGLSPETVRQIEIRALRKLKEQAPGLEDYMV